MNSVPWHYFDKFDIICDQYLPARGEGDTMASQIVTAVCKLVYKWYNDGDVFDNTYLLEGWWNDLSDFANWLYKNVPESSDILISIGNCSSDGDYENLLKDLADTLLDETLLNEYAQFAKSGTVYSCAGPFKFVEDDEDEEEDYFEDDEDEEEDEEDW